MEYVDGEVVFSSLAGTDAYGKFSIMVSLDKEATKKLEDEGIHLKEYEGKKQRTFKTQFNFQYVDADNKKLEGEPTRGSKVTIAYELGKPYREYGVTTYLKGIKVIEAAKPTGKGAVFVDTAEIYNSDIPF